MGSKPSNIFPMDRPESGGADRHQEREKLGMLGRAKVDVAQSERFKHQAQPQQRRHNQSARPSTRGRR
jgi:hypothetical protein